jgi:hypothetical protein
VEGLRVARGRGSHIFRHLAHRWRQGCQPYAPAACYPPGNFLVLIPARVWIDLRAIARLEGLGKLKKSTSSGTLTGNLPACSIVPQPTTLPTFLYIIYLRPTWILLSHMLHGFPTGLFSLGFRLQLLCISRLQRIFNAPLFSSCLIIVIIFDEDRKLWSPSLCFSAASFLQTLEVCACLLRPGTNFCDHTKQQVKSQFCML